MMRDPWRLLLLLSPLTLLSSANAFQAPLLGIGSILFPIRNKEFIGISSLSFTEKRTTLYDASDFFVDAFWTAKVGGGANQLTPQQRKQLEQSQLAEFNKRYGTLRKMNSAELLVCRSGKNKIVACAGVEIDNIPNDCLTGPSKTKAPLMSNLAVSRQFRRRGLAEEMVNAVERLVRDEWNHDECYLYVEERNRGAVKLYQKLGYRKVWKDPYAETLLPTSDGSLRNTRTTIVCMRKQLAGSNSFWNSLFSR